MRSPAAMAAVFLALSTAASAEAPLVAVASNLTQPMTEIAEQFRERAGIRVRLSFGSSGNFAHQILQGAPYDIFLSADPGYIEKLGGGYTVRQFARGTLCAFIPTGSNFSGTASAEELFRKLAYGDYRRLSMANPEYAPYGKAAKQALQSGGLWVVEGDRMLIGENVAQAAQFTLAGGVDVGLIPCSFEVVPAFRGAGRFLPVPGAWYASIRQATVLLHAKEEANRRFFEFMHGEFARSVVQRYGYALPEEN